MLLTLLAKIRKAPSTDFSQHLKTSFGPTLSAFAPKTSKQDFSRKKQFRPTYKTFFCSNSCKKKNRNIPCVNFSCNLKKLILGPIWWFLAQNPQNKMFFKKNWAQSLFTFDNLNSHKNSENSYEWTYIWRVFQRTFTLWV